MVNTPVLGVENSGLSIYRQGKKISLHYGLLNAAGDTIASGPMRYG